MVKKKIRKKLNNRIQRYRLYSKKAYYTNIKRMFTKSYYEKSIYALMQYIKNSIVNPSEVIWNRYAVENNYLSAETIGYMSEIGFNKLCKKIRKMS